MVLQKNYMDANLRDVAREKSRASKEREKGQSSAIQGEQSNSKLQYRDRASERRTLFNQPDVSMPEPAHAKTPVKRSAEGPPPAPSPPPPPVAPGKDESNIGNKLLKMMGWTEGTGLGSEREGRVDPMYAWCLLFVSFRAPNYLHTVKQPSMLLALD